MYGISKSISGTLNQSVFLKHGSSLFSVSNPLGEKFLTHLRLKFSHLKEHKFRHGFVDTINPMCACGADVESTEHFLLNCHVYSSQRLELFDNLERANPDFKNLSDKEQVSFMIYGPKKKILLKMLIKILSKL